MLDQLVVHGGEDLRTLAVREVGIGKRLRQRVSESQSLYRMRGEAVLL